MVHRAPDSRLLTNLINHEKEYAKHFAAVFPLSHTALASLSAYAAASPSSQHTIAAVVDVLASADDALQRYARALDTWREQLVALKGLEDDLSAVLRDRDILVTRLIKASKSTRDAHRSSRLIAPLGSASLSSLPSTNSTAFSTTSSSPASSNAKLAQAQAELQACEAHLVSKEHELDARRITLARDGLGARCRALIDCGWVWGEMGKQGLRALEALSADGSGSGHPAPKQLLAVPPGFTTHLNPTKYGSDNSSLTPSQSASQTTVRSIETSQEGPASKENGRVQPETGLATISKQQARSVRANEDADLTITLPPAHAISELALPTGVRTQLRPLENGDPTPAANADTSAQSTLAPRRKRTKLPRRPPSQHIAEVSDEGSNEPSSASNRNANTSPRVHTPFPTTRAPRMQDTSSDDEPTGPLQVVENDPFEVIRRSMLGPAAGSPLLAATAPTARASAPDVRVSVVDDSSPPKFTFPGSVSYSGHGHGGEVGIGSPHDTVSSTARRQRRTSIAIFGSLRGLFRKPKERPGVEWGESPSSGSPNQKTKTSGWVTRTDARIKARGGDDSDGEVTPKGTGTTVNVTSLVNMSRGASGARLRKNRPGASVRENGPSRVPSHRGMDGWVTDTPAGTGAGASTGITTSGAGADTARSRTRQAMMKRKKTSVADLRGSDQGHTDGEVDQSLARASSEETGKEPESSTSMPVIEIGIGRQVVAPAEVNLVAVPNSKATVDPNVSQGTQHRRATTTTATTRRKLSSDAAPAHRRSASLSLVDAHMMIVSTSTTSQVPTQSMSWRKPPPQIEPFSQAVSPPQTASPSPSQAQSQSQPSSRTHEPQPKQNARRNLGNGHAKHVQNQSLMSIVADVTRQNLNQDGERDRAWMMDKARSLDIPRAPGSVLRERDREAGAAEREVGPAVPVNARGHARTASSLEDGGQVSQGQGQGQGQRAIRLPLKSALRNASRTPSPGPSPASAVAPTREVRTDAVKEDRRRVVSPVWRDSASISSYETGRESLEEELEGAPSPSPSPPRSPPLHSLSRPLVPRSQSQLPTWRSRSLDLSARSQTLLPLPPTLSFTFPPPPVDPPPVRVETTGSNPILAENANANEPPSSSVSTETPSIQRRKSVRVSLQPTFSPSPPALYDEDEEYVPWSEVRGEKERGRNGGKTGERQGDVWADSSDEDEAYSRARRLLSLVGRGKT